PDRDPLGASYNVIQAKIAVGSAGFWGKGFGLGTQTHLRFLPEAGTDFLFSAYIEEWGIFGGIVLLLTFGFVVFRITGIGLRSRNNYYRFISLGAALLLLIHFFVNAGSNLGLTPVTGIPFPFLSYGGSHLLTLGILTSIIQRVTIES
ncbi:MAG: FtsW/RodA/SpoVE family cell cycle protein, partial [Nanoarchaeota archaeon]|nr:FtsW/RodA/SpoVE family cell cycle protein [Nanoarchaeota archaeon]